MKKVKSLLNTRDLFLTGKIQGITEKKPKKVRNITLFLSQRFLKE